MGEDNLYLRLNEPDFDGKPDPIAAANEYWENFILQDIEHNISEFNRALDENGVGLKIAYNVDPPDLGFWHKETTAMEKCKSIIESHAREDLPIMQFQTSIPGKLFRTQPDLFREIGGYIGFQRQPYEGSERTSVFELKYYGASRALLLNEDGNINTTSLKIENPKIEDVTYLNSEMIWHTHPAVSTLSPGDVNVFVRHFQYLESNLPPESVLDSMFAGIYFPVVDKMQIYTVMHK